jgi:CxxC-x17-CxxC domain-containing protein
MGDYQKGNNRSGNRGGRPSYGGGSRNGDRGGDRGPVTMHKAVCDQCHKSCEVPFRPSENKPIYCKECFSGKKGNDDRGPRRDFGGDRAPRKEFNNERPAQVLPFKPASMGLSEEMKNQFKDINIKLDRLMDIIEKNATREVEQVSTPRAKSIVKKAVSKTKVSKKKK